MTLLMTQATDDIHLISDSDEGAAVCVGSAGFERDDELPGGKFTALELLRAYARNYLAYCDRIAGHKPPAGVEDNYRWIFTAEAYKQAREVIKGWGA